MKQPATHATSGRRPRRTVRDWVVDFSCFLLAVLLGLTAAHSLADQPGLSRPLAVLDPTLGVIACAAVWLRRRQPVGLAVAMVPVGLLSNTSGDVATVAVFTLAVHRPFRDVAWIGGVGLALVPLLYWLRPYPDLPDAGAVALT